MAVDTRNKRASILAFALPFGIYPNPDGTIDAADRQQTAYLYPGILANVATIILGGATVALQWWYWDEN